MMNPNQKVDFGALIIRPTDPIKNNYLFDAWYEDETLSTKWNFSFYPSQSMTLYAGWTFDDDTTVVNVVHTYEVFLEGTPDEFTIHKFLTDQPGPTILIMGGIHGDERAGFHTSTQMLDFNFKRGTVYVLPIANNRAATALKRYASPYQTDLNRAFPGDPEGTPTQRLAYTLINAIHDRNPQLVLDLHESQKAGTISPYLGNNIIIGLTPMPYFVLDVLERFNSDPFMAGKLPFSTLPSPKDGSINSTYSDLYHVPTITVETNRETVNSSVADEQVPLSERVAQQTLLVELFLKYFN
jgi:uncharacterized repeat protein (TIGR02543 family)